MTLVLDKKVQKHNARRTSGLVVYRVEDSVELCNNCTVVIQGQRECPALLVNAHHPFHESLLSDISSLINFKQVERPRCILSREKIEKIVELEGFFAWPGDVVKNLYG